MLPWYIKFGLKYCNVIIQVERSQQKGLKEIMEIICASEHLKGSEMFYGSDLINSGNSRIIRKCLIFAIF